MDALCQFKAHIRSFCKQAKTLGDNHQHSEFWQFTSPTTLVTKLCKDKDLHLIVNWITRFVQMYFPQVHTRYMVASPTDPQLSHMFGCFTQMSINCLTKVHNQAVSQAGVNTIRHIGWKTPAGGVCVVLSFSNFNSSRQHFLMLKDLGVALQVPKGVPVTFPSSLIAHGNIDGNINMVEADTAAEAQAGQGCPRGSIVFFCSANLVQINTLIGTGIFINPVHHPRFANSTSQKALKVLFGPASNTKVCLIINRCKPEGGDAPQSPWTRLVSGESQLPMTFTLSITSLIIPGCCKIPTVC
ncbi:hypothetical protein JCM5296_000209 [Sporobolomyces johnsonii]